MKAFILAGGEGTRLRPITLETPKPLITVKKKPILNYLIDLFKEHGVEDIVISINKSHVPDFSKWKRDHYPKRAFEFAVENDPLGTFGALMLAEHFLKNDQFFMSNGDELKAIDLTAMKKFHNENKSSATVCVVRQNEPQHYGVAICKGNRINEFIEKPENPPSKHVNSGLYIMEPEVFHYYPHRTLEHSMVEKDLFPALAPQGKLGGFKSDDQWFDCGTFERWEKAIREWRG